MFQFHKGTIKTGNIVGERDAYFSFNSIKVRLRRRPSRPVSPASLFQFHKGTIKTEAVA